jgi:hypothetical protein
MKALALVIFSRSTLSRRCRHWVRHLGLWREYGAGSCRALASNRQVNVFRSGRLRQLCQRVRPRIQAITRPVLFA